MPPPRKVRIRSLDYLKGILIAGVVVCHSFSPGSLPSSWILGFCMPAFFFASGILLKDSPASPAEAAGEIRKRFFSLMVPYFLWSLLWLLVWGTLTPQALCWIAHGSHKALFLAKALTSLWFLPVLFLACSAWSVARMAFGRHFGPWIRTLLAAAAFAAAFLLPRLRVGWPWGADVACCALACLAAGNLAAPAIARLRGFAARGGSALLLPLLLSFIGLAGTLAWRLNHPPHGYVNVAEASYGNSFLFLAVAASGTLFAVCLSVFLEAVLDGGRASLLRWLELLGMNALGILCIHRFLLRLLRPRAVSLHMPTPVSTLLLATAVLMGSAIVSQLLSRLFPPAVGLPFRKYALKQ